MLAIESVRSTARGTVAGIAVRRLFEANRKKRGPAIVGLSDSALSAIAGEWLSPRREPVSIRGVSRERSCALKPDDDLVTHMFPAYRRRHPRNHAAFEI